MENISAAFANGPESILTVVATLILPDQHRTVEDPRAVIKTDTSLSEVPGILSLIPFEFHMGMLRLKRIPPQSG